MSERIDLKREIDELLRLAGVTSNRKLVQQLVQSSLGLGTDQTNRLNVKIAAATLIEMRAAFQIFEPFAGIPKMSIFGSARTCLSEPAALQAKRIAQQMADLGWMTVTGAGPGIMEAAARGAGAEKALGVSIQLPFEETPNDVHAESKQHVAMKYFFTRKLMLVKESQGFVCLPGGYGTLDETFELLTLQQTGKMRPAPIVLLDAPQGTFWRGLERFVRAELESTGLISAGDFDRVRITDSVTDAVQEITSFWHNYRALRWFGNTLVLRVRRAPSETDLLELNQRFGQLLESGEFTLVTAHDTELQDLETPELPSIKAVFAKQKVGELHRVIRFLNSF